MSSPPTGQILRFGDFALDLAAYELRRHGRRVKLERQPMDLLILLIERPGHLVSRGDIVDRLWGKDVFVDVETGVNTAISKIRQALRDSAETPAFVETVAGRGYRFIAPIEVVVPPVPSTAAAAAPAQTTPVTVAEFRTRPDVPAPAGSRRRTIAVAVGLSIVALGTALVVALTRGGSPPPPPARITLAVLPFKNLGGDADRAYIADGLTDDTSASLAQIDSERFGVKGRTLVYKGTTKTAREIGQELAVDYLLESSVRAEGDRLRVTATLTRVHDQEHVWSQSFDRELTSALGLQRDLSEAIAEQIRLRLAGEPGRAPFQPTQNAEAYDAHLRGRYLAGLRTREGNAAAVAQYKKAIALDRNYTMAWASLAFTYAASAINSDARPLTVGPLARDAAAHALASNPNLADAQLVSGYVNWLLDWDWAKAEAQTRLAIRLDPGNGIRYRQLGHVLSQAGRHAEAKDAMRRARELEPLDPLAHALSSQVAVQARDYAAALEHARRAVEVESSMWIGHVMLAQAYERLGQPDLALEALTDAGRLSSDNSKVLALRGYVLARTGRTRDARAVSSTLEAASRDRYVPPYAIALIYAGLGERDAVVTWLERALAERDVHLMYLPVDSRWDPYREDSRFKALLARCGFARPAT